MLDKAFSPKPVLIFLFLFTSTLTTPSVLSVNQGRKVDPTHANLIFIANYDQVFDTQWIVPFVSHSSPLSEGRGLAPQVTQHIIPSPSSEFRTGNFSGSLPPSARIEPKFKFKIIIILVSMQKLTKSAICHG